MRFRLKRAVSEIVSISLLVLIAVALGTMLYVTAVNNVSNLYYRIRVSTDLAMAKLVDLPVLDAFYIDDNDTIVIIIYVSEDIAFNPYFKSAYVDGVAVPESSLIDGFFEYLTVGETHRLAINYPLSNGAHLIKLVDSHGAEVEVVVGVG